MSLRFQLVIIVGLLLMAAARLTGQPAAAIPENYYAAGENVALPAPVAGDAVVAGRIVTIAERVSGDVLAAGWRVSIDAAADDDVRAAGATVEVRAPVAGDLTVAAGDVTVDPTARVGGRAWLTGRTVNANGVFEREVRIAAERVVIGGEVHQPMQVIAQRLEVLPTAHIYGPLTYKGPAPAIVASGAKVSQPITYTKMPESEVRQARWPRAFSSVVFGFHIFVGGLLLLLLWPRVATRSGDALRSAPAQTLLAGLAVLFTTPFVALLLIVTLIGLPVGLALGAAYAVALFTAVVTTAIFIGNVEARWLKRPSPVTYTDRVMLMLAGVVTLALLHTIPVIGTVTVFASIVFGLGALAVTSSTSRRCRGG